MTLKSRLASDERLMGCFVAIPHPVAAEVCARQGLDLLCIDAEHSVLDRGTLEEMVRACDSRNTVAMVRVPGASAEWIASALDAGAEAVLVPRVSSVEEARAVASYGRYPPLGTRGAGPGRASRYGYEISEYIRNANDRVLIAVQIETAAGLANVDEIAGVEGIDMLFVGPGDLGLSIGAVDSEGRKRLEDAIYKIAISARRAGKFLGIFQLGPDDVERWAGAGYQFFIVGSDTLFIGSGIKRLLASAHGTETYDAAPTAFPL